VSGPALAAVDEQGRIALGTGGIARWEGRIERPDFVNALCDPESAEAMQINGPLRPKPE
jgi:hypothetical protein